jgi:hypothetical protein
VQQSARLRKRAGIALEKLEILNCNPRAFEAIARLSLLKKGQSLSIITLLTV